MKRVAFLFFFICSSVALAYDGSKYTWTLTSAGTDQYNLLLDAYNVINTEESWWYADDNISVGVRKNNGTGYWTAWFYRDKPYKAFSQYYQYTWEGYPTNIVVVGKDQRDTWYPLRFTRGNAAVPYDINPTNEYWTVNNSSTYNGVYIFNGYDQNGPVWRGNKANAHGMQYGIRWNENTSKWNLMVGNTVNTSEAVSKYNQTVTLGGVIFYRHTNGVCNITSPIERKAWKRHYVYGLADGTVYDPSGKIAPWTQAATIASTTRELAQIADAARVTASNNLERMYAVTNQVSTFTKKIFVQAQLYPDLTQLSNCWGRVVKEWTDGTNDHCWVYFSREFKVAPVMKRRYTGQTMTNEVQGVWADPTFTNQSVIVDGYAGCKELIYARPEAFVMKNCFTQPYFNWGTQENGFDFGTRVFTINDRLPLTTSWTNRLGKIFRFNNGALVGEPTDVQQ